MAEQSLTHFDADAMAAAQEVPTLTVGRFLYRGRLLSIREWMPFWEQLQALETRPIADGPTVPLERLRERLAFYESYLRAVFPKRDYRFWAPDPINGRKGILRRPFAEVEKVVGFFFTLQALATFGRNAFGEAMKTKPGTSSKPPASAPLVGASE